jgi:branched-chain amino acid transport system permease protein
MCTPLQTRLLIGFFALIACLPLLGLPNLVDRGTQVMILCLFALSLNALIGHIGSISFGHAAFYAIGGYTCMILMTRLGAPLWLAMPAAIALGALCALVIGYFCVRLNDIYFAMLTLAFSMLVWAVAYKWKDVTGGGDGLVGAKMPEWLRDRQALFWFTFVVVGVSTALLRALSNSTMGRTFIAIRENATRAAFVGVNVRRMRLTAFVIAGTFGSVAGCLMGLYVRGMFPESAFWAESGRVMIVVLLGGMHAFIGPIVGAVVLFLLEVATAQYFQYWPFVLGLVLLAIVMVAPDGLVARVALLRRKAPPAQDGGHA